MANMTSLSSHPQSHSQHGGFCLRKGECEPAIESINERVNRWMQKDWHCKTSSPNFEGKSNEGEQIKNIKNKKKKKIDGRANVDIQGNAEIYISWNFVVWCRGELCAQADVLHVRGMRLIVSREPNLPNSSSSFHAGGGRRSRWRRELHTARTLRRSIEVVASSWCYYAMFGASYSDGYCGFRGAPRFDSIGECQN